MRKIYILVFALFTCLIAAKEMYAVCKEEADNISYDIIYVDNEDEGLKIKTIIYDIDENLYIKVKNDYDNQEATYTSSDFNDYGYITYQNPNVFKNVNFTINVYSNDETCSNEVLRTIKYNTNKYNPYSVNDVCDGYENKIDLCASFYDVDNMTEEEFVNKVKDYKFDKSILGYIKRYYLYVLIPFLIGLVIFTIRLIIYKRRNKNA